MRRLLLALLTIFLAAPAWAAPTFSVTGATANSGSPLNFSVRRTSKDNSSAIITFQTVDGPIAKAGVDYAGTTLTFKMGSGKGVLTIPVATYTNQSYLGQKLSLGARISLSGRIVSTAGATIVEASPPNTPTTQTCPDGSIIPLAQTCPAVPPVGTPSTGATPIADNFTTSLGLEAAPGGIAGLSSDDVGAFRMLCDAGKLTYDDPVVFFGQPGASHLHVVWGNQGMDANSTYSTLRTTGTTTCGDPTYAVNRTAYWMPAMLDGAGNVVLPDLIQNYYKQIPANTADCLSRATACVPLPNGIKYVYGYNPVTQTGGINDVNSMDYWAAKFVCWSDYAGTVAAAGVFHTIPAAVAAGCPAGAILNIIFAGPGCWDGVNLDTPDHRSHLSYGTPETGGQKCPADHPYLIAAWQGQVFYTTDANFTAGKWHFSSDEMRPDLPAGSTLHFDYEEAWSPTVKQTWQAQCIDRHATCSSGDLGNGTRIKHAESPSFSPHRLVPVPARP